jgi:hypothetical protein
MPDDDFAESGLIAVLGIFAQQFDVGLFLHLTY